VFCIPELEIEIEPWWASQWVNTKIIQEGEKLCWYLFPVLPAREETNWCSQDLIFCVVHISSGLYLKMIALDFNGHNGNSLMVVDMRQWNQVLEHHLWKMLRFFVFLFGFPFSLDTR
jgi:hypothetical protein